LQSTVSIVVLGLEFCGLCLAIGVTAWSQSWGFRFGHISAQRFQ